MIDLDHTHDLQRRSWLAAASGHADFPIQNLPIGVFSPTGGDPRGGIAIGDRILDLRAALAGGLFSGEALAAAEVAARAPLNSFLAMGAPARRALRRSVSDLLAEGAAQQREVAACLHAMSDCTLHLPAHIGDYTDFYAGIHHATNVGKLFRPDNPLLPNYKHVPIGYHGRASSIRTSGTPVRRPSGQIKPPNAEAPTFGPTQRLDYELEMGIWIGAGNQLGETIDIAGATQHIAGLCLLNDWSARDIQSWEYQPLGPFLAKSFATTISPWIIMPEALTPFRIPQPERPIGDPSPLPYLVDDRDQETGAFDVELEVLLLTAQLRSRRLPPHRLAVSNAKHMYWTAAQLVTHHASNGCNLQPGDLLGTGTISGPTADNCGSLLETTAGGSQPITLPTGEQRRFLEDGDEILLQARCKREGFASIGFGECRAAVLPRSSQT